MNIVFKMNERIFFMNIVFKSIWYFVDIFTN